MASPQVENGYVKIANELFEALCKIRISGEARQVFDVILRKTYGFNKKEDKISYSQFSELTNMNRQSCIRATRKLLAMNLINVTNNGNSRIYAINKDFESWKVLPKKVTVTNNGNLGVTNNGNKGLPKKVTKVLPKKLHTKDMFKNTFKNNEKDMGNSHAGDNGFSDLSVYWNAVLGRHPRLGENEFISEMVQAFGKVRTKKIIREFADNDFHKLVTMRNAIDWNTGKIKPKEDKEEPEWLKD